MSDSRNQLELDERYMRQAIRFAARGVGRTSENPSVGCVMVKDGRVLAVTRTSDSGRPHAETEAIRLAGENCAGATAYVTLEPCAHQGRTGPCCVALAEAGVARVVIALKDPDERVTGKGIAYLHSRGVEVVTGVLASAAAKGLDGYLMRQTLGRPLIVAKSAVSLDGRIAMENGDSKWITGDLARKAGHLLRAICDGIVVGGATVVADSPSLTCRLKGMEGQSPTRVLLDRRGVVPAEHSFYAKAEANPIIAVSPHEALDGRGGVTRLSPTLDLDLIQLSKRLGELGLSRLLVEGGARVLAEFAKADLIDEWHIFTSGKLLGGEQLAMIAGLGLQELPREPAFTLEAQRRLGDDWLVQLKRKR